MTKFLSKWLRKFHRWIAVPTAILIPVLFSARLFGGTEMTDTLGKLEKIPSFLMLLMAVSGTYLFLLPYIAKSKRNKKLAPKPPLTDS